MMAEKETMTTQTTEKRPSLVRSKPLLHSCDFCEAQEEGGHYCLLHSCQLQNANLWTCPDFKRMTGPHFRVYKIWWIRVGELRWVETNREIKARTDSEAQNKMRKTYDKSGFSGMSMIAMPLGCDANATNDDLGRSEAG